MKIVFLVSGGGGSMKCVHQYFLKHDASIKVIAVIADRQCEALHYAQLHNIPNYNIKYNTNNRTELRSLLNKLDPDLIVTNIHKVIDSEILKQHPNKLINLHYSILPAFSGLIGMKTIEEARKLNTLFLGSTCHEVTEVLDGGKIISQCSFPVNWDRDENLIIDTVFKSACLILINSILKRQENKTENSIDSITINSSVISFNPSLGIDPKVVFSIFSSIAGFK